MSASQRPLKRPFDGEHDSSSDADTHKPVPKRLKSLKDRDNYEQRFSGAYSSSEQGRDITSPSSFVDEDEHTALNESLKQERDEIDTSQHSNDHTIEIQQRKKSLIETSHTKSHIRDKILHTKTQDKQTVLNPVAIAATNVRRKVETSYDTARATNHPTLEQLKLEIYKAICAYEVGEKDKKIVLPAEVKAVWSRRYYQQFYTRQVWYDASWEKTNIMEEYSLIMSILVEISFSAWESFKDIFIDQERKDANLPFKLEELQGPEFLEIIHGGNFYKHQYRYCPVRIEEREDPYVLVDPERLPWVDEVPQYLGQGESATVMKRTIAAGFLKYNEKGVNEEPKAVAIKSVPGNKVRKQEFDNLKNLRGCLSKHTRIMVNLATIENAGDLGTTCHHILYEVAAYDLDVFLTTPPSGHWRKRQASAAVGRNNSWNMSARDLIEEAQNLADALNYLHNHLYNGKRISLAHNDIKPNNILVVYPDNTDSSIRHPAGIWKLTDFGLSRVKDKRTNVEDKSEDDANLLRAGNTVASRSSVETDITHRLESSASVSKTLPKRCPGKYTAPELDRDRADKSDGRKADIWSFGCVLSEVITYAVRLDCELVEEFRKCVQYHSTNGRPSSLCFYTAGTNDVKPSFIEFLDQLPGKVQPDGRASCDSCWIKACADLVKEIVVSKPDGRLGVDKIRNKLRDIIEDMSLAGNLPTNERLYIDTNVTSDDLDPSSCTSPTQIESVASGMRSKFSPFQYTVDEPRTESEAPSHLQISSA